MAYHVDYDDNCFDVEDFSVDSFFRSLELQSRLTSSDLEFGFPSDLENAPISSSVTSSGILASSSAKCSNSRNELSMVKGGHMRSSESVGETSVAVENDDDNATAVDAFFASLQLRSCLLRTEKETAHIALHCEEHRPNANSSGGSLMVDASSARNTERVGDKADANVDCSRPVYLSMCASISEPKVNAVNKTSTASMSESKPVDQLISSMDVEYNCDRSLVNAGLPSQKDNYLHTVSETAVIEKPANGSETEKRSLKGGKVNCDVCRVELSSKYSYVRHLLTPLHRRRAEGYCVSRPSSTIINQNNSKDIVKLISRQKPSQCRVCCFYGDTLSQLLYHIMSTSHYQQVRRKCLLCLSCHFVGNCDDIVAHIKSDSHLTVVTQSKRPSVITVYRSNQHGAQVKTRNHTES